MSARGSSLSDRCHLIGFGLEEKTAARPGRPFFVALEHDPEKWEPVFPRDKRQRRLRGDHARRPSRYRATDAIRASEQTNNGCVGYDVAAGSLAIFSADWRRQSRHRQSSPLTGIGSRAGSSAHQHGPGMPQLNSVPQREQARRREAGISNQFVTKPTESWPCFSCRVHPARRYDQRSL